MLSKSTQDQVNQTQTQLFTLTGAAGLNAKAFQNASLPASGYTEMPRQVPTSGFSQMVVPSTPRKTAEPRMTMSMGQQKSFQPAPAQLGALGAASARASRNGQPYMMLSSGLAPSQSKGLFGPAPQMSAAAKFGGPVFGASLQNAALQYQMGTPQNRRGKTVMAAAATEAPPSVRNLDIASFTESRPQETAKIDNINEKGDVPNNTYKPKDPFTGKVVLNETLTGPDAGEVCHVVFETDGKLPYAEGQSIGIVAKGEDAKGKPHKLRLYSIASSAPGDYGDGKTVSLCVKRLIYTNDAGEEVKGVCSNYICDLKQGEEVAITGPVGKALLLPKDPNATVIMLATGTGIAPFRSFLWRFFFEKHPDYKFDGRAWLFMGVPTTSALLYDNEFKEMKNIAGDQFQYDYAISREAKDKDGNKMYIQNKMKEYGQELWDLMQKDNTYVYMCGLKGMESGIQEALGGFAKENGVEWSDFVKGMKKAGRYHVEVY